MGLFSDGDVVRTRTRLRSASGEDIVNVFHHVMSLASPQTDATVIPVINSFMNSMYGYIQPGIPSDVSFVDIDVQNVTTGDVYPAYPWPSLTVGGGTGDTMPEQCCALVVGRTGRTKTIARKFLGPFIEAANNDGAWYGTLLTQLGSFLDNYTANINISAGNLLIPIAARYLLGVIDSYAQIKSGYTSTGIYTQRRRRRGVGA